MLKWSFGGAGWRPCVRVKLWNARPRGAPPPGLNVLAHSKLERHGQSQAHCQWHVQVQVTPSSHHSSSSCQCTVPSRQFLQVEYYFKFTVTHWQVHVT